MLPLTPQSHSFLFSVRPVGFEPTPTRVKAGDAAVTPRPQNWSGVCVSSGVSSTSFLLLVVKVVRGGVERAPPRSGGLTGDLSDRHAHRYNTGPCFSREGGTRTHDLVHPKHVGLPLPYIPSLSFQSERQDLNLRSPGPRPGAITRLRYVLLQVPRTGVEPVSPA